jgi:hypothetical protein
VKARSMDLSGRVRTPMAMCRASRWGSAVVVSLAPKVMACASPTLPLPPPGYPSVGTGPDADHVVLASPCGGVEPWATVVIVNENTSLPSDERGAVAFADQCGAWGASVYAHAGDWLEVWQESGTSKSDAVLFPVTPP